MNTFNIVLPESMLEFVEEQILKKGHGNLSDYISDIIAQEQEKESKKLLEIALIEGLDSGEPLEITEEWWLNKKQQIINHQKQAY